MLRKKTSLFTHVQNAPLPAIKAFSSPKLITIFATVLLVLILAPLVVTEFYIQPQTQLTKAHNNAGSRMRVKTKHLLMAHRVIKVQISSNKTKEISI